MGKGKRKGSESHQEATRGFPDAFDKDPSSDSGSSTIALTSRDKGKGREVSDDEDEPMINTMWQTEDGRKQWLGSMTLSTTLQEATERAHRHLRLRGIEEELPRIVHVRQEGREVPIEDDYDFEALKKRAANSQDPLYPVIIRIYTLDGATPRRQSIGGSSRSISPTKLETPLLNLKRSTSRNDPAGVNHSPASLVSRRDRTERDSLKKLHKNQERRKKHRKQFIKAEGGGVASKVEYTPTKELLDVSPEALTAKRPRSSSLTTSTTAQSARKKRRKHQSRISSSRADNQLPSPDSNIHPAIRATMDGSWKGSKRYRPVKPSPLAGAAPRDPPNGDPSVLVDDEMEEDEDDENETRNQDPVEDDVADSDREAEEEPKLAIEYAPALTVEALAAEAPPEAPPPVSSINEDENGPPDDQGHSEEAPVGSSAGVRPSDLEKETSKKHPVSASVHQREPRSRPSALSPSRNSNSEGPSDRATSATSHRSPSLELDGQGNDTQSKPAATILAPRRLPPSTQKPKKKHVSSKPSTNLEATAVPIVPTTETDPLPNTSLAIIPTVHTPLKQIELAEPAWNWFRKPASPIFTAAYSSSSIDTPPEGSAEYRKRSPKRHSRKKTESKSADPSTSIAMSDPPAASSKSAHRNRAVEIVPDLESASTVSPVLATEGVDRVDQNLEEQDPDPAVDRKVKPAAKKKPPSLAAQIMAKHRSKLEAEPSETPAKVLADDSGSLDSSEAARSLEGMIDALLPPSTTTASSVKPTAKNSRKRAPLVEAARSGVPRSPSADELDVMDEDIMDIHPSLSMPDLDIADPEQSRRVVQSSPSSRDANSVEDVVGDRIPTTAQVSSADETPAQSSKSPDSSTHLLSDLPPQPARKDRRVRHRGRLQGIDLDIEDKEMEGLSAAAQRAKLAGRGICIVCGTSPMHLQKDCPKVKAGVETLRALLLQRQTEAEAEQATSLHEKKTLKNGTKGRISEETLASIEAIEGWIRRLTAVRNKVMGLEVNVEKSKTPIKELTMAEELDALSAQSTETVPKRQSSVNDIDSSTPDRLNPSASHARPSHLPPLLQRALAKPHKAGSTSGVSVSDALIETGESGSDSDSDGAEDPQSDGAEDSGKESLDEGDREQTDPEEASDSGFMEAETASQPNQSPSLDDDLDLDSFMKRPPTKDQIRRAHLSAASMQPIEPPSVASDAESVDVSVESEPLPRHDSGSSIGDFDGVESRKAESEESRSVIDSHTPPPIATVPTEHGTTAVVITGADQSTKSNRSYMALHDRGSSSPVVDTFAGARALREAIEEERTPMSGAVGLPSPPASAADLPAAQPAESNSQPKRSRKQTSSLLAPAAEISPRKQSPSVPRAPKSPSVQPPRHRSTSRSSAIIQAHRDSLLSLPNGRSRLNTSSSPETRLRQIPTTDTSPGTLSRKPRASREVIIEVPLKTKAGRMSMAPVSEREDDVPPNGTGRRPTESPRMATRSTPGRSEVKASGSEQIDRMRTPERSVAPSSTASSTGLQLDFNSGLGVRTPVQPSPKRTRKTRSSQVDELESSQPVVGSSSTVKRELITQRNAASQRSQPNGTSQVSVTSSRRGRSSLADGVSDSYPDPHESRLRSSSSQRAPTQSSAVPEASHEGSDIDGEGDRTNDGSATGSESDDDTTIPSRPPLRPPVAIHRRAQSQQIINPIPSLSQLPTEILRNGSLRSHVRSSATSQPTPSTKRPNADSESESEGESDLSSSEEENVSPEKRGRIANGRKPKAKANGAPVLGW